MAFVATCLLDRGMGTSQIASDNRLDQLAITSARRLGPVSKLLPRPLPPASAQQRCGLGAPHGQPSSAGTAAARRPATSRWNLGQ